MLRRLYYFNNQKGERVFESRDYSEIQSERCWYFFHVFYEKYYPVIKFQYEEV